MPAEAVGHRVCRVFAHGATAHHMGAAQACAVQLQAQAVDQRAGFLQRLYVTGVVMQRQHGLRAGGELDLRHAVEGATDAVPGVVGHPVVEHRGVVAAQAHRAFRAVRVEAVAHQGEDHVGVRQLFHAQGVVDAEAAKQGGGQRGLQRRHFQLVGHAPGDPVVPLEVVAVDRLRRAVERVDRLLELRGAEVHHVQEGALAGPLVRVRRLRAHEDRRSIDAAAGQHVVPRADRDLAAVGRHAAFVHAQAFQPGDPVALQQQAVGPRQVEQLAAFLQRRRDGGDQHRLLGVGRAAHPAVADVPAAAHVARDHFPVIAELLAAGADHVVVGVRRDRPGRDAQALFHLPEPGRHLRRAVALDAVLLRPVFEGRIGRAEAGGPVDQGGAADGAALEDGDGAVLAHPADAFLVEAGVGLRLLHAEVGAGLQRAFFHQQHLETGGAEDFRRGAATGAGADHHHVGFQGQVVFQARAIVDFPAAGQAFGKGIGYRHHEFSSFLLGPRVRGDDGAQIFGGPG
ncbi:hypothetical protein D3C76_699200 [compost metagenome]